MKNAVIITGKLVQDHEYIYPYYRLQEAGFIVDVAVRNKEMVLGQLGTKVIPTMDISDVDIDAVDLIVLPGGAKSLEYLRQDQGALDIISAAHKKGKVIAAICHGSQMLISAKIVKGKKISGYYSIKDDIENAGATYIDAPVVVDDKIVTSPHYKYLGDWMHETLKAAGREKPVALTPAQISFYKKNGYLIIQKMYSEKEINRMLAVFEEHASSDHGALMNPDRIDHRIHAFMKDSPMVDVLESLQRHGVSAVSTQMLFKKVGSPYADQAWNPHQDNSYTQSKPGVYITANVFFEDANQENGCLYIYPGSHTKGILPFEPIKSYREKSGTSPGNRIKGLDKFKKLDLVVKKGDVFFMCGELVHGSYGNKSKTKSRPMFSVCCVTSGGKFNPGKSAKRVEIPLR